MRFHRLPCTSPIFCLNSFPLSYHCNCPRSPPCSDYNTAFIWPRIDATPFFRSAVFSPFANHHVSPDLLLSLSQPVHSLTLRFGFSIYNRVCGHLSLFPSGSFARLEKQSNKVGEMRTCSQQHGVSVSVDLLLPVYWIDADQSTATRRPCRSQ